MKSIFNKAAMVCLVFMSCAIPAAAQGQEHEIVSIIKEKDNLFWKAYNNCDVAAMQHFFTRDLEFYHDKGGEMKGLTAFAENIKNGLCGNEAFRLRREAVPGSIQVFSMEKNGVVYGAIISGSHHFYINEKGKPEYLDGLAKFTHLWLLEDGVWKMSRVLSYDHGPAQRVNSNAR